MVAAVTNATIDITFFVFIAVIIVYYTIKEL
jgi:hypothetical protein